MNVKLIVNAETSYVSKEQAEEIIIQGTSLLNLFNHCHH